VGLLLGLVLGLGLFLIVTSGSDRPRQRPRRRSLRSRAGSLLLAADVRAVTGGQLIAGSVVAAVVACLLVAAISHAVPVALAFGLFAGLLPRAILRRRARMRAKARHDAWPEAVDNLVSGVRAGLSLPEALSALGESGPAELRPPFRRFAADHRATGAFVQCLDHLGADLADPVGDRVVEALRVAREVGGSDLGTVLRTLARFLREDGRTRGEVEARQSWTVNAARVALAAPWVVLLLHASQSSTVSAYNSAAGAVVLALGGATSYLAYWLMRRIGRLPDEQRVLR
jgi:tight adherence protein B